MVKLSTGRELKLKNETKIETWQPINGFALKVFTLPLWMGLLILKLGPEINGKLKRDILLKRGIVKRLSHSCRRFWNDSTNMD
jgi:hypothetical protein